MSDGIVRSPDCTQGKCVSCTGDGWDFEADRHAPCPCECHGEMALPTAPGVTIFASNVKWACPSCGEEGVGERSLLGHAERHIEQAHVARITRLDLRGLSFLPGALTVITHPEGGD